jgi:ABC-type branched-subunit amino acid transport system substrate-binding protein
MDMTIAASIAAPQAQSEPMWPAAKRAAAFFALLFLAGCQSVIPKGGQAPAGPPPVVTPDPGNVVLTDADRHRVALLVPVTGPDGDMGQSIANATTLALLDTRNANIRMTTYDTALGVDAAVRKAVADGNKLILGPLRSDDVVAVANVAKPAGVPMISFSNDVGAAGQNVFLLGHLPNQSIDRVVKYANAQGLNRFAGIVPKSVYGQRALSHLTVSVRSAGGTLISIQEVDGSVASIDAAARRLVNAGMVDAVLIADSARVAVATVPALRRAGLANAKILGTDLWNLDSGLAANAAIRGAWFASVADTNFNQYAGKYRTRFGRAPSRLSSLGYDSVLLVARVAQDWKVGTRFPTARLTDADGFIGIDGAFRFMGNGMSERALEVREVQAGKYATIDAAPRGFTVPKAVK